MGQAKVKQRATFSDALIREWESEDCVNFAVALGRLTGWLIHVDWWTTSLDPEDDSPEDSFIPLRVYVGDNRDRVFDVRGNKSIFEFTERTIKNLALKVSNGNGGVRTRFYEEKRLSTLPLKYTPNEEKINQAMLRIQENNLFLSTIPARKIPLIPAWQAAQFTYGRCTAYAEALKEIVGLQPVALLAKRFSPSFEGTRRSASGYFHSIVLHPDGIGEDSWGKSSVDEIASRFGVLEYQISIREHEEVIENHLRNSGELFQNALKQAKELIMLYRPPV